MKTVTTIFLFLIFLFSSLKFSAQCAIVLDEGGFVNVYDSEKEELDRLGSESIVFIEEMDGEWALVDYTKYGQYAASTGYIKKNNIVELSSYQELPLKKETDAEVILGDDYLSIKLSSKPFDKEKHSIAYFSEESKDILSTIDGKEFWGTKMGFPTLEYANIEINRGGNTLPFPRQSLDNLFNPLLSLTKAYYDKEQDTLYLYSTSGDITAPYTVLWVIEEGKYAQHYIFD